MVALLLLGLACQKVRFKAGCLLMIGWVMGVIRIKILILVSMRVLMVIRLISLMIRLLGMKSYILSSMKQQEKTIWSIILLPKSRKN